MSSLLFFFYISSTQLCEGRQAKTTFCTLPPHPENGRYVILEPEIPNLSPGDELHYFTLDVKCDPGYHNTMNGIFTCYEDGGSFGEISECLPQCRRENIGGSSFGFRSGLELRCIDRASLWDDSVMERFVPDDQKGILMDQVSECGVLPGVFAAAAVSGGRFVLQHELPWHAGIYTKTKKPYMQICGGSLVSETVVISAAHCFWDEGQKKLPASNYAVAVGKLYRPWNDQHDEDAQKSDVAEIKIPPRFQGEETNLQDDIALVIVSSSFQFTNGVRPVCLNFDVEIDKKHVAAGSEGHVAGWGLTSEDGPASPVLKVVTMPVIAIDRCIDNSDPSFKSHITSDKICAGYQNDTAVCKGDSGGGLIFVDLVNGDFRYFLRGVVSGAPRNEHLCNTFAWATYTHLLSHQHFIRETVPETSSRPETPTAQPRVLQSPSLDKYLPKPRVPPTFKDVDINLEIDIVPETSYRVGTLAAQAQDFQKPFSTLDMPSKQYNEVPETSSLRLRLELRLLLSKR